MRLLALLLSLAPLLAQPDSVRTWLGVRYAAPPVGTLRWRAPQPGPKWDPAVPASKYGPACMQQSATITEISEDCLTLNIWSPAGARKLPVMVWIHGGAFRIGSGSMRVYDGTALARQGVVLVTINYRLGLFGFFAHPGLPADAPANFGLLDQIAALHWVHDNIARAGGDPGNVTIFGESAGGVSVDCLMVSPLARGLFEHAIAESGGGFQPFKTLEATEREGDLKTWYAKSAQELVSEAGPVRPGGGPVIDGKSLTGQPARLFAEGKQAPVPFIAGSNSFEASLMTAFKTTPESILAIAGDTPLRKLYPEDPQEAATSLYTDGGFTAPARFLVRNMAKAGAKGWVYFFAGLGPRANHGSEIPYVFGNLLRTAEGRELSDAMMGYWVQFAKTSDPNGASRPAWPAGTEKTLEFGPTIVLREHFRKEKLDLLEGALLPRL